MATVRHSGFGEALRHHRVAAGLTQEALAECAGLSRRGISDLERGVNQLPHKETVVLLAQALMLSPQERAVFEMAAQRRWAGTAACDTRPPFVGRAVERAILQRHLRGEGAPVLLLAGEPGLGKTRLLVEAAHQARDQGWRVLEGGCHRSDGQEPYAPVLEALNGYIRQRPSLRLRAELAGCGWLVRLLPELADGPIEPLPRWALPATQERRLMDEAVARFLANVAGPAGTLLVLDDLHWAGSDALGLLTTLVRTTRAQSVRLIGAYRDTEVPPRAPLACWLADLVHENLGRQHDLRPLAPDEAATLLDALVAERTDLGRDLRARLLQRAGGVPFFLVSCVQAVAADANATVARDALPWTVAQSIRQRVVTLPEAGQQVVGAAAVIGRVVPRSLLLVAVLTEQELLTGLEAACRARLLIEEGTQAYRFAHDMIREVVEADLGAARRAVLHRRIAEVLEGRPGPIPVELLAYHFRYSGEQDRAIPYLEQAGDRARAQYAHAAAAGHYQGLADCLVGLGRERDAAAAREKLGAVLITAARYDEALAVLEAAAMTYHAAGDLPHLGSVMAQMGWAYAQKGTPEEGVARIQPLLAPLETHGPSPTLAALYVALARLCVVAARFDEEVAASARAVEVARALEDESLLAQATGRHGLALLHVGRLDESLRVLEEAACLARAVGDLFSLCRALVHRAAAHEHRGEFDPSRTSLEAALEVAARLGDPTQVACITSWRGLLAFYTGAWAEGAHSPCPAKVRSLSPPFAPCTCPWWRRMSWRRDVTRAVGLVDAGRPTQEKE